MYTLTMSLSRDFGDPRKYNTTLMSQSLMLNILLGLVFLFNECEVT